MSAFVEQAAVGVEPPLTVIEPSVGWMSLRLKELWAYRELFYFLAWRDVKVRYKQTALGIAWVVVQPVVQMILFTAVFGHVAKLPSQGVPYPLFTFAALLPWTLFSGALARAGISVVGSAQLISKIYFPRLIIPLSAVLANLVDFAVSVLVLAALMAYYGYVPPLAAVTLPLFVLLTIVTAVGVGLWFGALNVRYRDIGYIIPFLLQVWMFASPIAYSSTLISHSYAWVYSLNPIATVADGFRWSLLGTAPPQLTNVVSSVSVAVVVAVTGAFYFRRLEKTFADVV